MLLRLGFYPLVIFLLFGAGEGALAKTSPPENEITIKTAISDPIEILFQIGLSETRRGNYASAIKIFETLTKETSSPRVQLELARALFLAHRYEEAKVVFERVLTDTEDLPWTVQENVRAYLDAIDDVLGYFKFSFSLVTDNNPRNFTDARQVRVLGQPLTIIPPEDNKDIYGIRYQVDASKAFTKTASLLAYLSTSYSDYEHSQFDRWTADCGLLLAPRNYPKTKFRLGLEEAYYGGDHLYEFPYAGFILTPDPIFHFKTSSELKIGLLRVPNAPQYDATNVSLTTTSSRPFSEQLSFMWELYLENAHADEDPYSYYGGSIGVGVGFKFLDVWGIKPFASIGLRKYRAPDVFFGETRRDQKIVLSLKLYNHGMKFIGFGPEIEVRYDKNDSRVEYYSFDKLQFFMNLVSYDF